MIRGGRKLYGAESDDEDEVGPDLTVQANAIAFRDKLHVSQSSYSSPTPTTPSKSITYNAITRYLNSLKQEEDEKSKTTRPESAPPLRQTPPKQQTKPGLANSVDRATNKQNRAKSSIAFNTVTLNLHPDKPPAPKPTLRNYKAKYNYHLETNYPEPEPADNEDTEIPQNELDVEFIDLDYYGRDKPILEKQPQPQRQQRTSSNESLLSVKRASQPRKPPIPQPTPISSAPKKSSTSKLRGKAPTTHLTITAPVIQHVQQPSPTTPNTPSPPISPLADTTDSTRSLTPTRLNRSRPTTPNTLLKRVSARPTPSILSTSRPPSSQGTSRPPSSQGTSRPPSSQGISRPSTASRPSRPSTASSTISSKSTASTKRKNSKAPAPMASINETSTNAEEELLLSNTNKNAKYLNTEYFSDDDEYKNLPSNTEALTEKQLSIIIRSFMIDLHLFQLCFYDDFSRAIINKRLSLATKDTTTVNKFDESVAVNSHVLNFLGENGLSDKVRFILNAIHKRNETKITEGNILEAEDSAKIFPPMSPGIYRHVEAAIWKILRRELKSFLRTQLEPFLNLPMQAILDYIRTKVLKGKVKRFASVQLADHFTSHEIANLHFAINDPQFVCEGEERVWWNEEESKVGYYDSDANLTLPLLTGWMRKIDKFFLKGVLSAPCYVCKISKLKFFDTVKCPTCIAVGSTQEFYNRYYCKDQCLYTHMNTTHSVYIAAPIMRNEMCEVCKAVHELFICKKCHSVLDFHGQHRLVILHERNCTGPK